ncbi:hypothetical protein BVC80_9083g61 [Macleaya cordata]|uniref:Uncharacterized protein n=1 Tax=Macleaya cordata TaxID=56857 RepID=A0A200PRE6_MACCD|nr:hypothetical protein BVC80_9083g61 [Macleaya cordata]
MEKASKKRDPPPTMNFSDDKQLVMTPTSYYLNFKPLTTPIWKLSPRNGGSTLYDSYELRAVTQQLNRTIRCSQTCSSTYPSQLKSPFVPFERRLDRIYKENAKTPKRVVCSRSVGGAISKAKLGKTKSFIPRLWKKVKRTFLRSNKQVAINN